eukprot:1801845-Rhodomonas_salina.7
MPAIASCSRTPSRTDPPTNTRFLRALVFAFPLLVLLGPNATDAPGIICATALTVSGGFGSGQGVAHVVPAAPEGGPAQPASRDGARGGRERLEGLCLLLQLAPADGRLAIVRTEVRSAPPDGASSPSRPVSIVSVVNLLVLLCVERDRSEGVQMDMTDRRVLLPFVDLHANTLLVAHASAERCRSLSSYLVSEPGLTARADVGARAQRRRARQQLRRDHQVLASLLAECVATLRCCVAGSFEYLAIQASSATISTTRQLLRQLEATFAKDPGAHACIRTDGPLNAAVGTGANCARVDVVLGVWGGVLLTATRGRGRSGVDEEDEAEAEELLLMPPPLTLGERGREESCAPVGGVRVAPRQRALAS